MTSQYILRTEAHPVAGDAYVVVTDHRDDAYLGPLAPARRHHGGTVIQVDDLGALAERPAREELARRLVAAKVGYVAVAPRLESFRENMLLGLWGVLATLDDDPELDARPGLLVAPDAASFAALIDRSIAYRPTPRAAFRPFVISQLGDGSPGRDAVAPEARGAAQSCSAGSASRPPAWSCASSPATGPASRARTSGWRGRAARAGSWPRCPSRPRRAFDEASLIVMFGHGTPGMICGMRVEAFDRRSFANKVVLCGSCMSAAPDAIRLAARCASGPTAPRSSPAGSGMLMEAVERGAVVTYAHMRVNAGFPHLFPVLESLLRGETVGEAYQRLIDGLLTWTRLEPDDLVLAKSDQDDEIAAMRRNQMLYVLVGDPALRPLEPLDVANTPR